MVLDDVLLALLGGRDSSAWELMQRHGEIFGSARRLDIVRVMAAVTRLERSGFLRVDTAAEPWVPWLSVALLAAVGVSVTRRWRRHRDVLALARSTQAGPLVVLDDPTARAFAVPGAPGYVVVTTLTRLHEKGAVTRHRDGRAFRYGALSDAAGLVAERMSRLLADEPDRASVLRRFVGTLDDRDEEVLRALLREHPED